MRLFFLLISTLLLQACGQADYSTWNCFENGDPNKKVVMVLQQSNLKIGDQTLKFCGSLGLVSYFDQNCQTDTKQATAQLITSESRLTIGSQQYRCDKL
jgi:hypothetical protein